MSIHYLNFKLNNNINGHNDAPKKTVITHFFKFLRGVNIKVLNSNSACLNFKMIINNF